MIHSLFGFPFSCTVPTVTNAQYITPNTINREIQINLRNITRESQQTFQNPLFGTHCEALQQPAAIETADNRKSCNCSGDSGDFLYIHIITVTGIIYRKKEKIWCKKLSPPKNTIELSCKDRVKYKRSFGKGLKKIVQKCAILAKRCERLAPQLSCASSWRIETLCTMLDAELETGHLKWTLQPTAGLRSRKNCDGIWRHLLPRPCSPSVEYTLDGGLSASYKSPRDKIPKYLCLPNVKWGCKFFCLKGGGKYAPVVGKGIQWDKPSFVWSSFGFIHCWSLIQWLTTKYSDFINVHSWNILFGAELLTPIFEKRNNS